MPDRFGGASDYSQQFAYLYDQNLAMLERNAEEADERRESDQAAKDQQVFDRYNAGKITDEALLAYIRRRISETGYDKEQQADWKKALLEYSESINDAKAAQAFEKTNDYAGYISYLRGKMAGMKGNSAKKAELEKQIQQLVDARDQGSVTAGADRILLQIQKGKATYRDLLDFYRDKLTTVNDPQLRSQIKEQITQVMGRVKADNIENRIGALDRQLAAGTLTPAQYGRQLQNIAESSGYKTTDAARYNDLMTTGSKFINTVQDMGRLEEIEGKLLRKEITPQQAQRLYELEADRYKITDPKTYHAIRNIGWEVGHREPEPEEGATPLPNPGVLGLPDGTRGSADKTTYGSGVKNKVFAFITQIDGTEYGQVNCVYAASAMLAYAMGYREQGGSAVTGGDLRYLSGDRGIGTNLDEAQSALGQLGISGLRNWNDKNVSFEGFKKRVGQRGMPAVLMGVNNNLPDSLKAFQGAARGHGVFVAAYDPKKDAFLWYDPAVSKNQNPNYKGIWVDADVVKNFGWGPAYSDSTGSWSFNGQALFAPPGTIKGNFSADNVRRPPIKYVNVDDAPVRAETPKRYHGYNHRGPSTVESAGNRVVDSRGKPRAGKNGRWFTEDGNRIDTVEEVEAELNKNGKRLELIGQLGEAWAKGKDRVKIGGETYVLNEELFKELDQETLDLFDRDILFAEAAGLDGVISERTKNRIDFLAGAATRNSLKADTIFNTAIRDAKRDFDMAVEDPDPERAMNAARVIGGRLRILKGVLNIGTKTNTPLDDLTLDPEVPGSVPDLDATIELMDMVADRTTDIPLVDRLDQIMELADRAGAAFGSDNEANNNDLGRLVQNIMDQTDIQRQVDRGELVPFIDGKTGKMGAAPVVTDIDPLTGQEVSFPVMVDDNGNQVQGIQVPVQTPTGVKMQWVRPGQSAPIGQMLVWNGKDANDFDFTKSVPLTGAQLAKLDAATLAQMVQSGQLVPQPITVPIVTMPPQRVNGKLVPGKTFYQDPSSGAWWTGRVPINDMGERNMTFPEFIGIGADLQPELGWRPYATAGMYPSPYQGTRKAIQDAVDAGLIPPPQVSGRDGDGNVSNDPITFPKFHTPYDPLASADYMNKPELDDPDDRAERIERGLKQVFDNVQKAKGVGWGLPGIDNTPIPGIDDVDDDPKVHEYDIPSAEEAGFSKPLGGAPETNVTRWSPPGGPTNQLGQIQNPQYELTRLANNLGIKTNGAQRLEAWRNVNRVLEGVKSKQGGYTPPAPTRVKNRPPRGPQSTLPRIGSVSVGGTRIDLPERTTVRRPEKDDKYTPPTPPKKTSGAGGTGGTTSGTPQQYGNY